MCRMDRKRGAGVADEIVDGGLRIPKGRSEGERERGRGNTTGRMRKRSGVVKAAAVAVTPGRCGRRVAIMAGPSLGTAIFHLESEFERI